MAESTTGVTPEPGELPQGRFSGRNDFRDLVRDAFAAAVREDWRQIIISDADFDDWPLGERAVAQSLNDWSRSGRSFVMIARNYDTLIREHARFVTWRKTWGHIIECWACGSADPLEMPSAIWSPQWAMHRLDPERCNGVAGREPERRVALRESLDEWVRKSAPGFPASTLGL
ncbi:hypothetical protein ACO2Q9_00685 [Variovorax sp. VNK109]|jgi:hypothetical protein|uniref:hypothetical protein n=1 Tax=Variovorax sp. VNK109 TaxID=3400919 RepID=UPI003BFBF15E